MSKDEKVKHTAGPWTVHMDDTDIWVEPSDPSKNVVCDVVCRDDESTDEDEANARLIATAPELLEALQRAIVLLAATRDFIEENPIKEYGVHFDDADCDGYCLREDCMSALELAEKAISKATGQAEKVSA